MWPCTFAHSMLSATNGVAGSGKKPRKSRGKGLRTNTGWYVNRYTNQPSIHCCDTSLPWRLYCWARTQAFLIVAQENDILTRSQYHLPQATHQMRRGKTNMWALCKRAEAMRVRHGCHYSCSGRGTPDASIYIDNRKYDYHVHGKQTWSTYEVFAHPAG